MPIVNLIKQNVTLSISLFLVCLAFLSLRVYLPPQLAEELPPDLVSGKIVILHRGDAGINGTLSVVTDPEQYAGDDEMVSVDVMTGKARVSQGDYRKIYLSHVEVDLAQTSIKATDYEWFAPPGENILVSPNHASYVKSQPKLEDDTHQVSLFHQDDTLAVAIETDEPQNMSWTSDGQKLAFNTEQHVHILTLDGEHIQTPIPTNFTLARQFIWSSNDTYLLVYGDNPTNKEQIWDESPVLFFAYSDHDKHRNFPYVKENDSSVQLSYYEATGNGASDSEYMRMKTFNNSGKMIDSTETEFRKFGLARSSPTQIYMHKRFAVILESYMGRFNERRYEFDNEFILHLFNIETEQLHEVITLDGSNVERDPFYRENEFIWSDLLKPVVWSPTADEFVYADPYGRLHFYDTETNTDKILTDKPLLFGRGGAGTMKGYDVATWSPDGKYIAAMGRYRFGQPKWSNLSWLHIIDVATGKVYRVGEPIAFYQNVPSATNTTYISVQWEEE